MVLPVQIILSLKIVDQDFEYIENCIPSNQQLQEIIKYIFIPHA